MNLQANDFRSNSRCRFRISRTTDSRTRRGDWTDRTRYHRTEPDLQGSRSNRRRTTEHDRYVLLVFPFRAPHLMLIFDYQSQIISRRTSFLSLEILMERQRNSQRLTRIKEKLVEECSVSCWCSYSFSPLYYSLWVFLTLLLSSHFALREARSWSLHRDVQ